VYSVQDVRVTLDPNQGWQCGCKGYAPGLECTHIEQARVFRQMRGSKRDDDTIELELSAEELQALYIAGSVEHTDFRPAATLVIPKRVPTHSRWTAVLAAAGITALSSGITYLLATDREQPIRVAGHGSLPALVAREHEAPAPPPVKFVNPFDATEVFEFSPGVSETEARDAVAEVLLSRARDRLAGVDAPGRGTKAVHRSKPAPAARLANRS
jgi:hypothetical protein